MHVPCEIFEVMLKKATDSGGLTFDFRFRHGTHALGTHARLDCLGPAGGEVVDLGSL